MLFPNLTVERFTLSPSARNPLQNPALNKRKVDDEIIKQLLQGDGGHPNAPSSASSEVLFKSIINNPTHQEFINKIKSVEADWNMMHIGFTGQKDVNHEAYHFLYRYICSDKNGNTGFPLLMDTKTPLNKSSINYEQLYIQINILY